MFEKTGQVLQKYFTFDNGKDESTYFYKNIFLHLKNNF